MNQMTLTKCLMVRKYFNKSMLVERIIAHQKGPFLSWGNGLGINFMIGIEIWLRENLSRYSGIEEPHWEPSYMCYVTQ